jgi:hypothetical protein
MKQEIIDQFINKNKTSIKMYIYSIVEVFQPVLNSRKENSMSVDTISLFLYESIISTIKERLEKEEYCFTVYFLEYSINFRLDDTAEWSVTIQPHIRTLTFDFQNIPNRMLDSFAVKILDNQK